MKKFALIGNPNCGKTTLFNSLTGSTAYVGNWPGVTVEKREGVYKKGSEQVSIVDLPGIYSLSPYSPEEIISRDFILHNKPDCIINIIDATNLERNLYLTLQVLETNIPVVVALNMIDLVKKEGTKINEKRLSELLGVPVVPISALKEQNLNALVEESIKTSNTKREAWTSLNNSKINDLIETLNKKLKEDKVDNSLFHAIKLAENDEKEIQDYPKYLRYIEEYKINFDDELFHQDLEALIANDRYEYITESLVSEVITKKEVDYYDIKSNSNISNKIDSVLTNKWVGIPIFFALLFVIFHLVFSEDLFYLHSLGVTFGNNFEGTMFEGLFYTSNGINSVGVILMNFVNSITGGFSEWIRGLMEGANVQSWAVGLVCDGVFSGIFAVIGFLPQILLLFLFFSILEDSGYMARVAFILDRALRKFGVSGKAFMPMIMGFGCSVPAMINTRSLSDEKERIATIRVIPFFSCGAKLPILVAVAGSMVIMFNVPNADLITFLIYVLGMSVAVLTLILMKSTTMKGEKPPFIMELPQYHLPQIKALMIHLWDKIKHFIKKAFTIIFISTIFIRVLQHFTWDWQYIDNSIDKSILESLGQFVQPLFTPLGFGSQLTSLGWVFAVAAITGLIAKEQVPATLTILAVSIGASGIDVEGNGIDAMVFMINQTGLTFAGALSFIVFNLLTIPCFAAVATARGELRRGTFKWTLLFWIATSYIVSSFVYTVITWWWSLFIWLVVITLVFIGIYLFNLYRDGKLNIKGLRK